MNKIMKWFDGFLIFQVSLVEIADFTNRLKGDTCISAVQIFSIEYNDMTFQ